MKPGSERELQAEASNVNPKNNKMTTRVPFHQGGSRNFRKASHKSGAMLRPARLAGAPGEAS
jgi:hypothetical protein